MKFTTSAGSQTAIDPTLQPLTVRLDARMVTIGTNLLRESSRPCTIREISRTEAQVTTRTTIGLNDHVFLEVAGADDVIGCAVLHRTEDKVWLRFLRSLTSQQVLDMASRASETGNRARH